MAVTRINNNQITDASAGNVYLGINANTKIQNYSITAGKIANNLTYGSDLTVSGNLTVNGQSTAIDTTITTIEDPVIVLASTQTGSPAVDIGFIGERGTSNNIAFVWDESSSEFVTAFTDTSETSTTINIIGYADIHTNDANIGGNAVINGTTSLVGNLVGAVNATGNITGGNVLTPGLVSATGNITSGANITGANILTGGIVSATGTITGGNIDTGGNVSATGNITGGNIISGNAVIGNINVSGDITVNSLTANTFVSAIGNVQAGNVLTAGLISATGTITSAETITGGNLATGGTVSATANITGGNIITTGITSTGSLTASTTISATGNITGGNLVTTGDTRTGTLETTGNALIGGNLIVNGNVSYININDLRVEDPIIILGTGPNGAPLTVNDGLDRGIYMEYYISNVGTANAFMGFDNSSGNMFIANDVNFTANDIVGVNSYGTLQAGNLYIQSAVSTGNITSGNLLTGGLVSAAGNVTGGNIDTGGLVGTNQLSLSGNVISPLNITGNTTSGNLLTPGIVSSVGNIYAPAIVNNGTYNTQVALGASTGIIAIETNGNTTQFGPSGTISLSGASQINGGTFGGSGITLGTSQTDIFQNRDGNVTIQVGTGGATTSTWTFANSGNLLAPGNISAVGNITGANIVGTTSGQFGNIVISGDDITDTNGRVNFNTAGGDVDFAVNGDTVANVFYVDAGTGTASFGSATQTVNAVVAFNATTSILAPVGNTAQRPATGVTGMIRFNTTNNAVEVYDNTQWVSVGVPVFTVIADQQFNGDGTTVAFTLGSTQTTNSCIVSINGVVQIPTLAYAVAGTDPTCVLTFTEAPAVGDVIDVRQITTTTTVTSIANSSGNAIVATSETAAQVNVTGDLSVSGTILGGNLNSTAITFGTSNMSVVASGGNIRANIAGTTVQTISPGLVAITGDLSVSGNATLSGNILGDRIQNGTTQIDIQTPGGNANINIGGTGNLAVFSPGALNMTGNIIPTANVTYNLGSTTQRWNDLWLSNSTIYLGNSQISANATSLIFTNPQGGQTVLAGTTANITAATVSTTGNITGSFILGNGSQLTGIDATSIQNGTSSVSVIASGGNVRANIAGATVTTTYASGLAVTGLISATGTINGTTLTGTSLTVSTGNITGGNLLLSGAIEDSGQLDIRTTASNGNIVLTPNGTGNVNISGNVMPTANAIANIGGVGSSFNTIFAKATLAQYADLAEKYTADAEYAPGTVVSFGGTHEVTLSTQDADRRVAGVVSTNPSYIMNGGLEGANVATVALTGRVPTRVTGTVAKGDLMVSNGDGTARAEQDPRAGAIIGKALEDSEGDAVIEVVVGRF